MTKQGSMWQNYYNLAKPRMVYANLLVAAAGMAYASHHNFNWPLFAYMLAGLGFVIAAACVFNNYYDRDIDARMERTKNRALAAGIITNRSALMYGGILFVLGVALLYFFTTPTALAAALAGFLVYVALYTPLKHRTPLALFVGAFAGATPPVVGYAAVTNALDGAVALLFLFLFVWQLPHFLAIAVYRGEEYAAAKVPVFMRGPYSAAQKKAARRIFLGSLIVLLAWCAALAVI